MIKTEQPDKGFDNDDIDRSKNIDLNQFTGQVDTKEPISEIQIAIGHAIANGDIKRLISKVMNGASLDRSIE